MAEKEYIEHGTLLEVLESLLKFHHPYTPMGATVEQVIKRTKEAPAADVVEVRRGEWVHSDLAATWHGKDECSECHYHTADRVDLSYFNYCPNCGAEMKGKERVIRIELH